MPDPTSGGSDFYSRYLLPGPKWQAGADEAYNREQSIDPETGALKLQGLAPANVGMQWQQLHNQAVWNYRQRLMQSSTGYLQGALGNLQRFRPGGAAAMESGVYQNIAGNLMQRAELTQPLDLMADYRRDAAAQARRQARRGALMQAAVQLGSAAIGAIAGPGAGAAANAIGTAANNYNNGPQAQLNPQTGGASLPEGQGYGPPGPVPSTQQGGIAPENVGAFGQALQSGFGTGQAQLNPQTGGAQGQYGPQAGPQSGGGATGSWEGGGGGGQQQRQAGPGAGGAQGGGGATGSWGGGGAMAQNDPTAQAQQLLLQDYMMHMLDHDRGFAMIDSAIETEAMLRSYGRAA